MKKVFIATAMLFMLTFAACSSGSDTSGAGDSNGASATASSATDALITESSSNKEDTASGTDENASAATPDTGAEDLYETISGGVTLPELNNLSEKYLMNTYGIDTSLCSSYVFYRATDVSDGTTIALFFVNDEADVTAIKEALEKAKAFDTESADGYNPETYEQFTSSEILTDGNLVYWIVSDETDAIYELIEGR